MTSTTTMPMTDATAIGTRVSPGVAPSSAAR